MGRNIEIEFAVNIDTPSTASFYLLQMRPIVDAREQIEENLLDINPDEALITSSGVLGNGIMTDIQDIIYIKSARFNAADNPRTARELSELNQKLSEENRPYILVGPGRWGSSDPWLGIPVKFSDISQARVIVECGLEKYRIEPSQGTHFFQNLTSLGVGYFTINPFRGEGRFDEAALDKMPAENETSSLRHVRFSNTLTVKMDGRKGLGVVIM